MASLLQKRIKELFSYDENTGLFTRLKTAGRFLKGTTAGYLRPDGYVQIKVDKVSYLAHRVAWVYVNGENPDCEIDHINHNRSDNKICNLRDVSRKENGMNCSSTKNRVLVTGVYFCKTRSRFVSGICIDGKNINIGSFTDYFEAICARKSAQNKHGYHKNHGQIEEN